MESNKGRLMRGALWIGTTRILINLTAFASTIILARLLIPEDFGLVAIATSVAAIISAITELSLSTALIQHPSPEDRHFHTAWTLNLVRAIFLGLLIAGSACPLAALYGDPRLGPIILVLGASTLIMGVYNPKLVKFERKLVFWHGFALNVSSKLIGFAVTVVIALMYRSYWALILGSVASQITLVIVSYILLPYRPRFGLSAHRELLSFSVWLTLSKGIQQLNWRSDPLAIGFFVSATALGYYSMGTRLSSMPIQESLGPLRNTLFPAFSRMRDDLPRLRAAYLRAQRLICTLAFPIGLGFAAVAEPAVRLFIGEKWLPSVPFIQVLAVVFASQAIEGVQPLAMATGRTKALFGRDVRAFFIRLPCMLGGLFIGREIGIGAIMGLLYGRAFASAINSVWNMQLVRQLINLPIMSQLAVGLRPALASAVMLIELLAIDSRIPALTGNAEGFMWLSGLIGLGAVLYLGNLTALWLVQGRPEGAEKDVIETGRGLLARMGRTARGTRG